MLKRLLQLLVEDRLVNMLNSQLLTRLFFKELSTRNFSASKQNGSTVTMSCTGRSCLERGTL